MKLLERLNRHFFPHVKNNHRPQVLQPPVLFLYLLIFSIFQFSFPFFLRSRGDVLGFATNIENEKLLLLTNEKRLAQGLKPLKLNKKLAQAAKAKAAYMFTNNFWAHNAPDGTTPWTFITKENYDYLYAGENLAKDFENSEDVVEAWMNSPTHRDNILQEKYEDIGFAVENGVLNGEETTLVVQMFGTPMPAGIKPAFEENSRTEIETPVVAENPQIKGQISIAFNTKISKFLLTKEFSIVFIGFLLLILLVDGFLIWKNNVTRISGRNLAHIMFLGSLLLIIFSLKTGSIL